MRPSDPSPLSSPVRKRQRLSSPTYDGQLGDVTQEDLDAFDAIEAELAHSSQSPVKGSQSSNSHQVQDGRVNSIADALNGKNMPELMSHGTSLLPEDTFSAAKCLPEALRLVDDPDNPFAGGFTAANKTIASFPLASSLPIIGFTTASSIGDGAPVNWQEYERSPSPEAPKQDYDSWFQPAPGNVLPAAFQTAKCASTTANPQLPGIGFMKASNKEWIAPSRVALAKAQEKMKDLWAEGNQGSRASDTDHSVSYNQDGENAFRTASSIATQSSPRRPALQAVENSLNSPGTPTPAGFSRPNITASFSSPAINQLKSSQARPFKSPLLKSNLVKANAASPTAGTGFAGSPLNPNNRPSGLPTFSTAGTQHPLAMAPLTAAAGTPPRVATMGGSSSFATPVRPSGLTPLIGSSRRTTPAPFFTPFKPGMKPGEPGRLQLGEIARDAKPRNITLTTPVKKNEGWLTRERLGYKGKQAERTGVFDLTKSPNRKSLASSGLLPQQYTSDELESMGINATELGQITPNLAIYYTFHTSSTTPIFLTPSRTSQSGHMLLGPSAARDELLDRGCTLATKPWVDNHWCLILWKLAGMVFLDPERENDPKDKRWCWIEVIRQLLYRYERELNGGSRPSLRLITTQDAPAAYPMVLCVSNITWSESGASDNSTPKERHPELEVTDGWYRLRAQVDAPLARAIHRGIIRVGRKIGVAGARLSSERKDPAEVLEAYNSTKLVLSGNSSHLVPWHTKLGFQQGPCISTLHSLTPDGGCVAAMDLVVTKVHPIAFIEFIEGEDGQKHREGPRSEGEESKVNEKWKRRREVEASRLHSKLDKKLDRYQGYIDWLNKRAGPQFRPNEDEYPPDNVDYLYDMLEDPAEAGRVIASLSSKEAGWLAQHIGNRIEKERELAGNEIERELESICPPREVRSFRVLIVQDARTQRHPANRTAQLTVWDVLSLSLAEGTVPGTFEVGQRYLVTNLIPTQQRAWMGHEPGSEVYLSTRRDSRWTPMKT